MATQNLFFPSAVQGPDLRRFQRVRVNLRVKFLFVRNGVKHLNFGRGDTLSEGGISMSTLQDLRQHERVVMEFELPYASRPVKLSGVIRYTAAAGYGVEFESPTTIQRQQLSRVCRAFSQRIQ